MTVTGLSSAEARRMLAVHGPNRMVHDPSRGRLREIATTLADPMALMLAGAAVVYFLLGETRDGAILLAALVPVLGVDVLLEARSRKALRKLAEAVAPRARAIRDGVEVSIAVEEIVPGDSLRFHEGDVLPADGVVVEAANLAVDESSLTGESEPVVKGAGAPFSAGSIVMAGQALGRVLATGAATEYGKIADLVQRSSPPATPLQQKTRGLVRRLSVAAMAVALFVFAAGALRGGSLAKAFLSAVSLAMAAVPEEFPLVLTLFLALGAWRLSRRKVLVRRMRSVETIGSATVICTDKTGTLTLGDFSLEEVAPLASALSERQLLEAALLACEIDPADPIERAIVERAREAGIDPAGVLSLWSLAYDHDFDPVGKHMSHVWRERRAPGRWRIVAKGALEGVLEHCGADAAARAAAESANARLASIGARVLAVAERSGAEPSRGIRSQDESGLGILGLLGFRDPVRAEVPEAMRECREAGIEVKLITGDHPLTALSVAEAAGLDPRGEVTTGDALDSLSPEEFRRQVTARSVFARIRPEQKHAIVSALVEAGEIVAMTGDGINDAPALRQASIGICMGERGTEVARAAADMVLLDDNFASVVAAVREGRHIFDNIRKSFLFLLAFHVPIVGLALIVPLVGLPPLLMPVHLVWLELVVHPISALVFEGEPPAPDLMRRPPRDPRAPILPRRFAILSLASGIVLTLGAFFLYATRWRTGEAMARSTALASVVFGGLALVLAERAGDRPWIRVSPPRTVRFWSVMALVALSVPAFIEIPVVAQALHLQRIGPRDWIAALAVALASVSWRGVGTARRARL
jgi:Ca2+-transporting ATPase